MSRNGVLKSGWVTMNPNDARVIDTNALAESKLRELAKKLAAETSENAEFTDGFSQGIDAVQVAELVGDAITEGEMEEPEEASLAQEELLEQARAEIEEMKQQAKAEMEAARKKALEEGKQQGYQAGLEQGKKEGFQQGHQEGLNSVKTEREKMLQEIAVKMEQIEQEYQKKMLTLEPKLMNTLTQIYEHIFQVSLKNSKDLVVHLISNTLRNAEGGGGYLVHVSKEDYPFVSMQKKELIKGTNIQPETVDIIEDATLSKSECMIETENGVFDCSLGTQLEALNEELCLLSYEPNKKDETG